MYSQRTTNMHPHENLKHLSKKRSVAMRTLNATIAKRLPLPPNHSAKARRRFAALESAPLFLADWMDVLFIHYRVDRERLQATVPFELDGLDGDAYVSLVAFSMRRLRPAFGGALTALPFKIIGETRFLNVRTYVRQDNDPGIYFMKEFMSSRLSAPLGPITYGLPYHFARLDYNCRHDGFTFDGRVRRTEGYERRLRLTARIAANSPGEERRANSEERRTTAKNEEQQNSSPRNTPPTPAIAGGAACSASGTIHGRCERSMPSSKTTTCCKPPATG